MRNAVKSAKSLALAVAVCVLAGPGPALCAPDPLDAVVAERKAAGHFLKARSSAAVARGRVTALVFRDKAGFGQLRVYEVARGKARLIHMAGGGASRVLLDPVHDRGPWPSLWGQKAPCLVYTQELKAMAQGTLHLLRYEGGRLVAMSEPLPMASLQDVNADGVPEVVSKSLPLGAFFMVECEETDFLTMARAAYKTTVYAWGDGRLRPASAAHPAFFDEDISRLEVELAADDPRKTGRYGSFLATALSIYFDYAEKGERRQGWSRFASIFKERAKGIPQVPSIKRCVSRLRGYVRGRLDIPPDWPD